MQRGKQGVLCVHHPYTPCTPSECHLWVRKHQGSGTKYKFDVSFLVKDGLQRASGQQRAASSSSALHRIPEGFDGREEVTAFGVVLFRELLEFTQDFFLARGQVHGGLDSQFNDHITS